MSIIEENADDAKRAMMQLLFARAEALIDRQELVREDIERVSVQVDKIYLQVSELVCRFEWKMYAENSITHRGVLIRLGASAEHLTSNMAFALVEVAGLLLVLLLVCLLSLRV